MRRYVSVLVIMGCVCLLASMVQAATYPHEPPGSTLISDEPFNAGQWPCTMCADDAGWNDIYNSAYIVQNPNGLTTPASPPYAVEFRYRTTQCTDCGAGGIYYGIGSFPYVYVSMRIMFNGAFIQYGSGTKIAHTQRANGNNIPIPVANMQNGQLKFEVYLPDFGNPPSCNCGLANIDYGQSVCKGPSDTTSCGPVVAYGVFPGGFTITPDAWHHLEYLVKAPSSDSTHDGWFLAWIDGTQVMNYTTISSTSSNVIQIDISPTYRGVPPNNLMFVWYDHVHVSWPPSAPAPDTIPPAPPTNLVAR